jgi:dCTP deaminase
MILNDLRIRELCSGDKPMIDPYKPLLSQEGMISYGASSFGYDMRAGNYWKVFTDMYTAVIDPKCKGQRYFEDFEIPDHEAIILPPNGYALTHSKEYVRMPRNVTGLCIGKSTYARVGIHVNITPLEAGWEGQVTIEISNATRLPIKVYAGEGIMQVLFFQGEDPECSYADRNGKYQGQLGVTLAMIK